MDKSAQQLAKENSELRDLCCFLDDGRQKTRRVAHDWQCFGRYTAAVLKNEVTEFETKLGVLQENLQKLSKENAELRDLCLFLNQMPGATNSKGASDSSVVGADGKSAKPEQYSAHSACVLEINKKAGEVPRYGNTTSETASSQSGDHQKQSHDKDKEYLSQLEARLEWLEKEKLELVKSLSAAHMITTAHASTDSEQQESVTSPLPSEKELEPPPDLHAFLKYISSEDGEPLHAQRRKTEERDMSTDDILKLVTLIDISRRLDAMPTQHSTNPIIQAEVSILRALIFVAWQQVKENRGRSEERRVEEEETQSSKSKPRQSPAILRTEL